MKFKTLIVVLISIAILFMIYTLGYTENWDYNSNTVTTGNNSITTYTDRHTNQTHGTRSSRIDNTAKTDSIRWSTTSKTNGNITTHTYTDKKTGVVTGGSTWKNENTTRSYGVTPPHPYKTD